MNSRRDVANMNKKISIDHTCSDYRTTDVDLSTDGDGD